MDRYGIVPQGAAQCHQVASLSSSLAVPNELTLKNTLHRINEKYFRTFEKPFRSLFVEEVFFVEEMLLLRKI
jgi:hypothetical protein